MLKNHSRSGHLVHDCRPRRRRVEHDKAPFFERRSNGKSASPQPSLDDVPVAHLDDDEHPIAGIPPVAQERRDGARHRLRRIE